ncbi:MAG: hypothetical protein P1S60_11180, partial [Anaerolineae bacterium]|nr:hypothetical protein [Anaerolineae bacterium]
DHISGQVETYLEQDRQIMLRLIATLSRPAIHYKVLAAGRNDPEDALKLVGHNLRENDAVCVGVFAADRMDMLQQDVAYLERYATK